MNKNEVEKEFKTIAILEKICISGGVIGVIGLIVTMIDFFTSN